ncbi:hypothetical protein [Streptomyces sp. Z26]|uniref:hypothetical protein n=1 Tax=Streptomyces sp. Z26 TaxID=2500177 RepID=UPI001404315E|nr:hypothetical protein [Streptomyces sp. Z26]
MTGPSDHGAGTTHPPRPARVRRTPTGAAALTAAAVAAALLLPGGGTAARADQRSDRAPGTTAAADTLVSPPKAAATWMAAQLTDGAHAKGDHGLTADIVLALAATGTGGDTADKATDWLETHAAEYVDRGTPGNVNAGGAAKLALVAAATHRDLADFGDLDLRGTLLGRLQDDGRFTDKASSGDMSNQFTQSLAVLALERTGELPSRAVEFLAKSRCADGGYPLTFKADPAKCKSHTDSTGLAVQALLAAGRTGDAAHGLDWLEKQQLPDGGFRDNGFGTPPGNSNSTALDVQALIAGGRVEAAGKGTAWLRSVQVGCDGAAEDRGAVGYAEPKADGTALRATAQAVPALAAKSLADVDTEGAAPGLEPVKCGPSGGDSGGTGGDGGAGDPGGDGGTGGAGGDTDGTSGDDTGGTDGGTDGATGSAGTATGGASSDGDAGGSDGGSGDTTAGTTTATSAGSTGSTGGGGSLASSGTTALGAGAAAAALLLAGGVTVVLARHRREAARG